MGDLRRVARPVVVGVGPDQPASDRCAHDVAILKEFSQMPNHEVSFLGDRMTWSEKNHILTQRTVLSVLHQVVLKREDLSSWRRLYHQAR